MSLFGKTLEILSESDLQGLIEAGFAENRVIEYKATLPGRADSDKREFVKDVISFANSAGGHIIYGIEAGAGIPAKLRGIPADQIDAEKLRLESIARTSIEPVIHGLKIEAVRLPNAGGCAIVIEIPRGLFGPHMIRGRGSFVTRNSSGKMDMDCGEVRAAFIGAETATTKLQEFHAERTAKLAASQAITRMQSRTLITLHLLPVESFIPGFRCDLGRITGHQTQKLLEPRESGFGWNPLFSFDGFAQIAAPNLHTLPAIAYAQVFRNGALEYVETEIPNSGIKALRPGFFECIVMSVTARFLAVAKQLEIHGPYFAFPSFLNSAGWKMSLPSYDYHPSAERLIELEHLILPAVKLENDSVDLQTAFRPTFDVFWNSCGWDGSKNYNKNGQYSGKWRDL